MTAEGLKHAWYSTLAMSGLPRLKSRWIGTHNVAVLMYHGVTLESLPFFNWCFLLQDEFRRQMAYLHQHVDVVPLEQAFDQVRSGRRPERPRVCITFDDGYRNNFDVAFPVLREFGFPATVFLATSFLDTQDLMWDSRLFLAMAGTKGGEVMWGGIPYRLEGPVEKADSYHQLCQALKPLPQDELGQAIDALVAQLLGGYGEGSERSPFDDARFQMLTSGMIHEMRDSGLVEFGAHTHRHSILARLDEASQREEIDTSIAMVAELTGKRCTTFAYPNGQPSDFTETSKRILMDHGVDMAVTTVMGGLHTGSPPLQIPRYGVGGDLSYAMFQCMVHHMLAG